MPRVSKKQSSPETLVRSEADRGTETVRSQAQRPRRNSIGVPRLTLAVKFEKSGLLSRDQYLKEYFGE